MCECGIVNCSHELIEEFWVLILVIDDFTTFNVVKLICYVSRLNSKIILFCTLLVLRPSFVTRCTVLAEIGMPLSGKIQYDINRPTRYDTLSMIH